MKKVINKMNFKDWDSTFPLPHPPDLVDVPRLEED
jgi:hypothetical protein